MKTIIGLVGAKGAGKTTSFYIIQELYGTLIREITLAGQLKQVCSEVFNIPLNMFNLPEYKEKELDTPVYLHSANLKELLQRYELEPTQEILNSHIGEILYTPRQVAQYVGTEILRAIDSDIHCKACLKSIQAAENKIGVVTDIRFPNELEFFKSHTEHFIPLYVKNTRAEIVAASDTHESERHLPFLAEKCISIPNNSSLMDLRIALAQILFNEMSKGVANG